jgi:hypothetical protein
VRSHAKASSVGSNSGLEQLRRAVVPAVAFCVLLLALLVPAFASAAETRMPSTTIEPFSEPGALAVDQGTDDVYVADYATDTVRRFDENGAAANFSALGSNEIGGFTLYSGEALEELAVDSTSHNLYVADYGHSAIRAFKGNGEPYEFTAGPGSGSNKLPGFTELCGVAVDSNGDIYMGDHGTGVHVYAPDGEEVASFAASQSCNVAVDSQGDVYVARYVFAEEEGVEKFTPSQFPVTASTTYTSAGLLTTAATFAIAVDPANDDVYVDLGDRIRVYDDSGALSYEFGTEITGSEGVAVDDANGQAYAADAGGEAVQAYGPAVLLPDASTEDATAVTTTTALLHGAAGAAGGPSTSCEFQYTTRTQFESEGFTGASTAPCSPTGTFTGESQNPVSGEAIGLIPGTYYRFRLVSTSSNGTSFGEALTFHSKIAPTIESESVESVGTDSADLSAVINPGFETTTYKVEFGATTAYGQTSPSATIGFEEDNSSHTVNVHVAGLTPGTAYHVRFVATNGTGTTNGADTTFATYPVQQAFGPCSNDDFRAGFGERLPDCRAYEQASPTDKHGANVQGGKELTQASSNGDRVTFYLLGGLPSSGGSSRLSAYVASRGPNGWSTDGLLPATEPGGEAFISGWSEDLSSTLVAAPTALLLRGDNGVFEPQLAGNLSIDAGVAGFAADTRHLIFQSELSLLPEVTGFGKHLYDLDHGKLTYVGRIPAGSATSCDDEAGPACIVSPTGSFSGRFENGFSAGLNTISRDGSKVFFSTPGGGKIYVREDGERTTWISASQRSMPDPNGTKPKLWWGATTNGTAAFFTSCEKLTDDSTAVSTGASDCETPQEHPSQGSDLYSYDTESGQLTDLSVDSNVSDAKGANVLGVLGTSADGAYVYFAANGVLAPGASPGNCGGFSPTACNLYVAHGGTVTFIARLSGSGESNWGKFENLRTSRVADDGTLLFRSTDSLTGYDSTRTNAEDCADTDCAEFFRYAPTTEQVICVTCNPAGLAPKGEPSLVRDRNGALFSGPGGALLLTRNLSANGKRVFFQTSDALLPADTNGNSGCPFVLGGRSCLDVYEWEAEGEGSCESESLNGGCLYLISSGKSPDPSYFLDASTNGDDVFFFTLQQLVPGDKDQLEDVYNASVDGGLASQHELTPPTCDGAACVANPPPPPPPSLSSSSFSGPGNAKSAPTKSRCPKGKRKVRSAGKSRCVSRHAKKKHHKRAQNKRANTNRGGSK